MATTPLRATIALILIVCYLSPQILAASGCTEAQNCSGCYNAKCIGCKTGYFKSSDNCTNSPVITSCRTYNPDGTCRYCTWPMVLTKKGECKSFCNNVTTWLQDTLGNKCVAVGSNPGDSSTVAYAGPAANCLDDSETVCQLCRKSQPQMSKVGDGCDELSPDVYVHNCLYYNSQLLCQQCIKGFALTPDSSACIKDSMGVSHCKKWLTQFGEYCEICHDGYHATDIDSCTKNSVVAVST